MFVLLVVGAFAAIFHFGGESVNPTVDAYFAAFKAGDYAQIYAGSHDEFRASMTEAQFVTFAQGIAEKLGAYKSRSMRSVNVNSANQRSTASVTYAAEFENDDATVSFVLMADKGGEWKLAGVNYQSPSLEAAMKCSSCGAVLHEFGKFCPNCGASLQAEQSAE